MAGADLVVDVTLLDASARSLAEIQGALDGLGRRRDGAEDIWVSKGIANAMGDLVSNWDIRAEKIAHKVEALRSMTEKCSEHFKQVDRDLGAELHEVMPPGILAAPLPGPR